MPCTETLSLTSGVAVGGSQNAVSANPGGLAQNLVGCIFTGTATAVTAGTSASTLIPSGVGTTTLPPNFLVAGKTIRIRFQGNFFTTATPGTTIITLGLGAATLLASTAFTAAASNGAGFIGEAVITCRTTGASGSVGASQIVFTPVASTGAVNVVANTSSSPVTLDTTASNALLLTSTNSVSGGAVFNVVNFTVEVLN